MVKDWPDNDEELICFGPSRLRENYWCLKDAFEGVQVFGGTGSGKSSGSGRGLAKAFLEANLGGLVLTAKPDEIDTWKAHAEATGRAPDLLIVDEDSPHCFNFLRYELQRPGKGSGHTENLVNLFCTVLESSERRSGTAGDPFWQRTLKQLLRSAIDLAVLAVGEVDLPALHKIIISAPRSYDEASDERWRASSACFILLEHAKERASSKGRESDLELTRNYWLAEFPGLAPETRASIVSMFTSMADCFLRGYLRKLLCTDITFRPEDTFDGKIVILNLPIKEYNELGQFAQVLFKYVWQRAVERRIPPGISRADAERTIRPVFLWADESQFFANSNDALFQSTARSSRACTVYLTQNLPSYQAVFGGSNAEASVDSFLGNLQTKIFHANGDPSTNGWASNSIGRTRQVQLSGGLSENTSARGNPATMNQSAGGNLVFEFLVQAQEFTTLKTGGPDHGFQVESIIFQGGRTWVASKNGKPIVQNYIRHNFSQRD